MKTIVVASRKGGAGKTCLTRHISVYAGLVGGGAVGVIDTDPAGGLAGWYEDRLSGGAEKPVWLDASDGLLPTLRRAEQDGLKYVIIDTPPAVSATIANVLAVADLAVIPVRPSADDLRQIGATIGLAEAARKQLVFVICQAAVGTRLTHEVSHALSQHGTVAPPIIHFRQEYARSSGDGLTVMETAKGSKAAAEVDGLWSYLSALLSKQDRESAHV
jgi:chromosome partitioning protein